MAPTSLPASGSDEQNAPSLTSFPSPNICGHHSPICSGVPFDTTDTAASVEPTSDSPIPASPQKSSSTAVTKPSPDSSKNCVAKKSSEYSPTFAASWRIGHGVCSRSSHSAAAGRITPAANSCTQSRISRTSLLSSRENPGVGSVMLPNSNMPSSPGKARLGHGRRNLAKQQSPTQRGQVFTSPRSHPRAARPSAAGILGTLSRASWLPAQAVVQPDRQRVKREERRKQ